MKIEKFIEEYTRAITEGYAAIFAGAGLSRPSGYSDWRGLLRPLAEEIELDVDKESDLIAIAQYYKNSRGTRNQINNKILNEYTKEVADNKNIEIVTRLPIATYWTTNYDTLLEDGLKRNNRKADIKRTQASLANNIYDRDAVVYKMHGDVNDPDKAVLTKDDYDKYATINPLFRTALQGDLISKTFLFIGFSFEDPNLDYILSSIKVLLGESTRDHYCFLKEVSRQDYGVDEVGTQNFHYASVKQKLRIEDLKRYGIQTILLSDYREITSILIKLEECSLLQSVFISGSVAELPESWDKKIFDTFTFELARSLVKGNYRIVSGFGLGIGSNIVNGALEEIMTSKYKHIDEHLCLRPFPQNIVGQVSLEELWHNYRKIMISEVGITIFIFGNKKVGDKLEIAGGMLKEFDIAKEMKKYIIPVGSTGGASKQILDEVKKDIDTYFYLKDYIEVLESCIDINELIKTIIIIIQNISKAELSKYMSTIYVEKTNTL